MAEKAIQQKRAQPLFVKPLTVTEVYQKLVKIAKASGPGSQDLKLRILTGMLVAAKPIEARYLIRIVEGKLRLGVGEMTILDGLAEAFLGSRSKRPMIEEAYNRAPDLGFIAKITAEKGEEGLMHIKVEPGRPIRPMLAERLQDLGEILKKTGGVAAAEWKYDGERAQIHRKEDKIWIFSRRLENITYQYPDVVEFMKKSIKAKEYIVEGEIVAIDPETREMKPFQELMHRKRKYDIHKIIEQYPVRVHLFDLMYLNGEEYLDRPYAIRRKKLEEIVEVNDNVQLTNKIIVENIEELEKWFYEAIENGCEGLIVKSIPVSYTHLTLPTKA